MKKHHILLSAVIAIGTVTAGFLLNNILKISVHNSSMSIIGGADGPTSIFLAGKVGGEDQVNEEAGISFMPLQITLQVTDYSDGILTALLINSSGYDIEYGRDYSLQKLDEGEWVDLIPDPSLIWTEDLLTLKDLEQVELTYDLKPFGDLDPGTYKLHTYIADSEFTI